MHLHQCIQGSRAKICFFEPDPENGSWKDAISHMQQAIGKIKAQLMARFNMLAHGQKLRSPDHFRTEGDLPNSKNYYAVKAGRIRAYGWWSTKHTGVFIVSHFAYKTGRKLAKEDHNKVCNNWQKVEI
jgi:hypothetical protein